MWSIWSTLGGLIVYHQLSSPCLKRPFSWYSARNAGVSSFISSRKQIGQQMLLQILVMTTDLSLWFLMLLSQVRLVLDDDPRGKFPSFSSLGLLFHCIKKRIIQDFQKLISKFIIKWLNCSFGPPSITIMWIWSSKFQLRDFGPLIITIVQFGYPKF